MASVIRVLRFHGTALILIVIASQLVGQRAVAQHDNASLRRRVEELIKQFDANTLSERSRAERELLEIGADALPLLPSLDLVESVSARESLKRLRVELERRVARDSSEPSLVTLRGEMTFAVLLNRIEQQTKNRLRLIGGEDAETSVVTVDWEKLPFWTVMDDLCRRGQRTWRFSSDQSTIEILVASERRRELATQTAGAFRIAVESVEIRPIVGDDSQRLVRINGRIAIEPRLRPLFLSMAAKSLTALDEKQQAFVPWNEDAKYEIPAGDGAHEVGIQWDFRLPASRTVTRLSVRGVMRCEIAAARERVVFDQSSLVKGALKRRGGVTVRIRQVRIERSDNQMADAEVGVTVSYDNGGPAFESHRAWMFYNAVYFETASGDRIDFQDNETAQQADGAVAIDYRWKDIALPPASFRFVYEAPTLIMNVPIEVNLAEFPLDKLAP